MVKPNKVIIKEATQKGKRLQAIFYKDGNKIKTVAFGAKNGSTYIDHQDDKKKENYLKRHKMLGTENWFRPMTAGALAKWILWTEPTLENAINRYKKLFRLI